MDRVEVTPGDSPVILGMPHTGTYIPEDIRDNTLPEAQTPSDTDWYAHKPNQRLLPGATMVRATFHRYVADANRDPSRCSLYPGQNTTGLVPLTNCDGSPLWNLDPTEAEIAARRDTHHARYHAALPAEIARIKAMHATAILYDCHSIRSLIPHLFEGRLPNFNTGTNNWRSCAKAFAAAVQRIGCATTKYTKLLNGRFKRGWSTWHYDLSGGGVHAIQIELAQATHLKKIEGPLFDFDPVKALPLQDMLGRILRTLETLALTSRRGA